MTYKYCKKCGVSHGVEGSVHFNCDECGAKPNYKHKANCSKKLTEEIVP